jgi:hypothetical protein
VRAAFGGDKSLKAVQQMMAASQAERDMEYFTFGEKYAGRTLEDWLLELNRFVVEHNLSVGMPSHTAPTAHTAHTRTHRTRRTQRTHRMTRG